MDSDLVLFALRAIEQYGGITEKHRDGFVAIVPPDLAQLLEVPEEFRLGSDDMPLLYGSPLLDRLINLSTGEIPLVFSQVEVPYLKKEGFDRLLGNDIFFYGCQTRIAGRAETRTTYSVLTCRYVALSDERKEGLVTLCVHDQSGALIDGVDAWFPELQLREYPAGAVPLQFSTDITGAVSSALRKAGGCAQADLADFLRSMERRLHRDVQNTKEYYASLQKEMEASLARSNLHDAQRRDRMAKIAMLPQEMEQKVVDLQAKYRVQVHIRGAALVRLLVNVAQVMVDIHFRKNSRSIALTWNPMTRQLDPLVCECCGETTRGVYPREANALVRLFCFACRQKG